MLDTGTQINLLSKDVATKIGEEIRPLEYGHSEEIRLWDGTEMEARGELVTTQSRNGKP